MLFNGNKTNNENSYKQNMNITWKEITRGGRDQQLEYIDILRLIRDGRLYELHKTEIYTWLCYKIITEKEFQHQYCNNYYRTSQGQQHIHKIGEVVWNKIQTISMLTVTGWNCRMCEDEDVY